MKRDYLLLVMTTVLSLKLILLLAVAYINVYQMVQWEMPFSEMAAGSLVPALKLLFLAMTLIFIVSAYRRDPKFMICALVSLATATVLGMPGCGVFGLLLGGCWLWISMKHPGEAERLGRRKAIVIIIVSAVVAIVTFVAVVGYSIGFFGGEEVVLEEGDWSEWETEKILEEKEPPIE